MKMETSTKVEYMCEINIGNERISINQEISENLKEFNFDKIIENVNKIRTESDVFLQNIIDNNKFLIANKNKKNNDDENFDDEN
jgi:hypothetical protein